MNLRAIGPKRNPKPVSKKMAYFFIMPIPEVELKCCCQKSVNFKAGSGQRAESDLIRSSDACSIVLINNGWIFYYGIHATFFLNFVDHGSEPNTFSFCFTKSN